MRTYQAISRIIRQTTRTKPLTQSSKTSTSRTQSRNVSSAIRQEQCHQTNLRTAICVEASSNRYVSMLLNGSAELTLPWAAVDALEEEDDGT
mmetsp:Transcript_27581/g.40988  ORF Transcript_27581/g.40988 Transcript_27581/m.40988 type:complete len:92 (+) Transcript_27581:722-997(+)